MWSFVPQIFRGQGQILLVLCSVSTLLGSLPSSI
jgi:hypothetical protein